MKTAFAKDIEYKTRYSTSLSIMDYEERIIERCKERGWIYKGIVIPLHERGAGRSKVLIESNGIENTPRIESVLNGVYTGTGPQKPPLKKYTKTEEEYLKEAIEFYDKLGWDVLGCAEPYKGIWTKLHLRCRCHGEIYSQANLSLTKRHGSLTCPAVRAVLSSIQNGSRQVTNSKDANKPILFYICRVGEKFFKFGISSRLDPMIRIKEHQHYSKVPVTLEYYKQFDIGWQAGDLETGIKKNIRGRKISKKLMTYGFTETLPISKLPEVMKFMEDYISLNPSEALYFEEECVLNYGDFIYSEEEIEKHLAEYANLTFDDIDEELDLEPLEAL
ncbi:hypothetical protein F8Y18_14670 [Salmonella enterica]|nr:hypothetical protein [Salmonella enterica]EHO5591407.1 hypothetical protein [Salmonella enterica]EHO5708865.1 hypothetical protein [Salmonella enterica]